MSFNLEEFKKALEPFGTDLIYIDNTPTEGQNDCLQFVVYNINYLYVLSNFGEFCKTQILPYYQKLIVLYMDDMSLKGTFIKA
jgi:hypothetical protein